MPVITPPPGIPVNQCRTTDYVMPKVSVILGVRNEYPVILGTIFSFIEELEFWGYEWEMIVVDNMSKDDTSSILKDKFRRWVKNGSLKVISYDERPANVTVRNVGVRAATGDVVFMADGHLSIATGTLHGMIQGWMKRGGLWHSAIQIWGDTRDIKCYGYEMKLRERFWGNLSRGCPKEVKRKNGVPVPYRVPMASHCCLMAGRKEFLDFGGYCEEFRCYGGGEPYLDLKWWLFGKEVWIHAPGLVRHAFGVNPRWDKVKKEKELRTKVYHRDGTMKSLVKPGDEFLRYSRGYAWNNDDFQYNFMLSAYTIGGYDWLQQRFGTYMEGRKGNRRYIDDIKRLRREVLKAGAADRKFIEERQVMTLDELLEKKPWQSYGDL